MASGVIRIGAAGLPAVRDLLGALVLVAVQGLRVIPDLADALRQFVAVVDSAAVQRGAVAGPMVAEATVGAVDKSS
ncbi:MAG TPA: hypothetical protein VEG64_15655 [Candidatus Sulfotelmatobacter sp.]|nr:hypothetical protein [Candidatus Sulfotelmatobacter sp.]